MRIGMRATAVATAVSLSLVSLTGCGKTAEKNRAAGIVPAVAIALVSFNLAPSISQKLNLQSILRKFPYKGAKDDFNAQLDRALSAAVKESGLSYKDDVKPWLGKEVAVAVLPGTPPGVAALIESKDDAKAKAALDKAKAKPESGFDYRIMRNFVVITEKGKTSVLDEIGKVTSTEKSLAGQAKFTRVEEALHGDRLLLGWADGKRGLQALQESQRTPIPFSPDQLLQGSDGIVGFDMHAAENAAVVEGVSRMTAQKTKPGAPRLTDGLPADSLGAFTIFDLATGIAEGMKLFGSAANMSQIEQQFEQVSGLNLRTDILSWMHGETVIVAAPGGTGAIPDFALVVAPSDHAAAEFGVAKIKTALGKIGVRLIDRDVEGAKASVAAQALFESIQPAFALYPDRFIFASSPAYLGALAKSASATLSGTDEFKHAIGASNANTTVQLVLRAAPIRDAIIKSLGPEGRAAYERDAAKFVEPLEALGLRSFVAGSLAHFEMKVTFK